MAKHKGKYFNNSISSLIIIGILLMPFSYFSFAPKASAQGYGYSTSAGGYQVQGNTIVGLKGYITGLAPAIANLPLCKADIGQGIKSLFGRKVGAGSGGSDSSIDIPILNPPAGVDTGGVVPNIPNNPYGAMIYTKSNLATNKTSNSFWDKIKNFIGISTVYAQSDPFAPYANEGDPSWDALDKEILTEIKNEDTTAKDLKSVNSAAGLKTTSTKTTDPASLKELQGINTNTKATASSTAAAAKNDSCWKSIGRLITKMMIQKITLSTIQWINTGFEGGPAFIKDPKYWTDLTSNELLKFGIEINDPKLYPFGKQYLQNTANYLNSTFARNATYTLDKLIKDTNPKNSAILFQDDFSRGGWSAWDAMTQTPANNPLGFNLIAANEYQRRQTEATQAVQNQLLQSGGFLDFKKCVDPVDLTQEENQKGLIERSITKKDTYAYRTCKKFVTVTPGQIVANAAINVANYPQNTLIQAQDLNDALAAITDAVLNQFNTKIQQEGFAALGDLSGSAGQFYSSEVSAVGSVSGDFDGGQILASSWLQQNPDFNIRTDLNQALVDTQKTYIQKLQAQNKELFSTTNEKDFKLDYDIDPITGASISNAYGLIPAIFQLDYCIPGPHPGFETDTAQQLESLSNEGISAQKQRMGFLGSETLNTFMSFAPYTTFIPVAGPFIAAGLSIVNSISSILNGANQQSAIKDSLNNALKIFTGISSDTGGTPAITDKGILFGDLNSILNRYIDLIHAIYKNELKPSVYIEAANEYDKVIGYSQMIKDNKATVASVTSFITQLNRIKDEVDALNGRLASGQIADQATYNTELKTYINAFGRLSVNLASGDDIANVDNLTKQIIDEKNYVYSDLLKGPLGCEKDLELNRQNLPMQIYDQQSPAYPAPILYDYRTIHAGGAIPDPWSSGYTNHIYKNVNYDANSSVHYLGFLSNFMVFDAAANWGKSVQDSGSGSSNNNGNAVTECFANDSLAVINPILDSNNEVACDHFLVHDLFALQSCEPGAQGDPINMVAYPRGKAGGNCGFSLRNFEKTIGIY